MAFCGKCGTQLEEGSQFCKSCGAPAGVPAQSMYQVTPQSAVQQPIAQTPPRKYSVAVWLVPLLLIFLFSCCCISSFAVLSLAGAKGQPATVIPPSSASESKTGASGTSVSIPTNLAASSTNEEINLNWDSVSDSDLKEYKVYKSLTPGEDFVLVGNTGASKTTIGDTDVKKGALYYYVVTAVTVGGAESGNSNQTSAIVDAPPLIPDGVYSWADVQKRCKADPKYLNLLKKVTGLTMDDVDRLVEKEKDGTNLKKTLVEGTIITNSTKNYKILPNYKLKKNRIALTDENGMPHVLAKCGNPMKIQIPVTTTSVVIQQTQIFITNIIMVMPPPVVNIFINAAQTVNGITVLVMPDGIRVIVGPTLAPPPPEVFIDPADFGTDSLYDEHELEIKPLDEHKEETTPEEEPQTPEEEEQLPEGQKWIEKGKLLVIADPPDPAPSQSVTMTLRLSPAKSGIEISYEVHGTDGYTSSGTVATDENGEIKFNIPGGKQGVKDTIKVTVPSESLEGSAEYVF